MKLRMEPGWVLFWRTVNPMLQLSKISINNGELLHDFKERMAWLPSFFFQKKNHSDFCKIDCKVKNGGFKNYHKNRNMIILEQKKISLMNRIIWSEIRIFEKRSHRCLLHFSSKTEVMAVWNEFIESLHID